MLNIKNLNIHYNKNHVIKNVNLNMKSGSISIFLGRTGCGKTSVLNSIANLIDFTGDITFNEIPIVNKNINIAMSTQHYDLYNFKTVYENIILGLKLRKQPINKDEVLKLIDFFSLTDFIHKYPDTLSGGQKQTVSLLRSIVTKPDLFLLDEPFSALDSFSRENSQKFLLDYLKTINCTTILITHSIEEAVFLGDNIFIFHGSPASISKTFTNNKGLNRYDDYFISQTKIIRNIFGLS